MGNIPMKNFRPAPSPMGAAGIPVKVVCPQCGKAGTLEPDIQPARAAKQADGGEFLWLILCFAKLAHVKSNFA
jgi:hypothetical protein